MKGLSQRQEQILRFIESYYGEAGYPPSVREIQQGLSLSSTSVVDYNLRALESKGYLRRNPHISRGIEFLGNRGVGRSVVAVPILGRIAAGDPVPVPQGGVAAVDASESIDVSSDLIAGQPEHQLFALVVKGHSMVDALISDGDIILLRPQSTAENGETVAVWLKSEKETTLKRFYHDGVQVRLQPANVTMEPIYTSPDNVEIQGRLVAVLRQVN